MHKIEQKEFTYEAYRAVAEQVPTWKLPCFFKKAFTDLQQALGLSDSDPATYFSRYKNVDWEGCQKKGFFAFIRMMFMKWDLEACVSAPSAEAAETDIPLTKAGNFPKTLQTLHIGAYHKVGETYERILAYAKENDLKVSKESFEVYLNCPKTTPTVELKTQIIVPLAG